MDKERLYVTLQEKLKHAENWEIDANIQILEAPENKTRRIEKIKLKRKQLFDKIITISKSKNK